ncbi:MAG: DivIVA domain-containing protein [Flammeovirgaceae bacterium]|nr:DivIVA domain-containing protein [Flammeovirgaceae bacterium]
MRITPLEIRRKTFEKKIRGFDKDEVNAFLGSLSQEWERLLDENKELRVKQEYADLEVKKLREVENSLYKTLKTAEDTGSHLIDQANRAAELHLKETQLNAEVIMRETKSKSKRILEETESQAKNIIGEMQDAIKELAKSYQNIEYHRDSLIGELQNIILDITDRINRSGKQQRHFKLEDYLIKVKNLVRESEGLTSEDSMITAMPIMEPIPKIAKDDLEAAEKLEQFIISKEEGNAVKKGRLVEEDRDEAFATSEKTKSKKKPDVPKNQSSDADNESSFFDQI